MLLLTSSRGMDLPIAECGANSVKCFAQVTECFKTEAAFATLWVTLIQNSGLKTTLIEGCGEGPGTKSRRQRNLVRHSDA